MPIATVKLASFPTTRNKPRPATSSATDITVSLPASGTVGVPGAAVRVLALNGNRTYFNIENLSDTNSMRFGYAALGSEGSPPPDLNTNGFLLQPGSGLADEPSPQELWAVNLSDTDGMLAIAISVEEGSG